MTNTESILSEIDELKQIALSDLDKLHADDDQLENWRISYLGRNGKLSSLMKILATIPNEDKRLVGPKINDLKDQLNKTFVAHKNNINKTEDGSDYFDNSLPGLNLSAGNYHPTTLINREICEALGSMGFEILEG